MQREPSGLCINAALAGCDVVLYVVLRTPRHSESASCDSGDVRFELLRAGEIRQEITVFIF